MTRTDIEVASTTGYPRTLILGGGFDSLSGTGITLSNLFRGWPTTRLAVVDYRTRPDTADFADAAYCLGALEQRWAWPLSRIPRRSGGSASEDSADAANPQATRSFDRPAWFRAARTALGRVGADAVLQRYVLSEPLRKMVREFSPDSLYCHFSDLATMRLVRAVHDCCGAKLAVHIMDDWPRTVYGGTLLGPALRTEIDREFRQLLSRASVRMAISPAMADEYLGRYGYQFEVFHNCIDVSLWRERRRTSWAVTSPLSVVYSGRIGWDALRSLQDVCEAVELMNRGALPAEFRIHSQDLGTPGAAALAGYPHTVMFPAVQDERLSAVLSGADVLVIPSDFEGRGRRFARLSMPTKVPAYMASGTPIVLYSPRTHAMCAWAEQAKWGLVVGERSPQRLAQALTDLAATQPLREALGRRAVEIADDEFDGRRARAAFKRALA